MDVDDKAAPPAATEKEFLPEVEIYLSLLVLLLVHDQKENEKGFKLVTELVQRIQSSNRRTLDQLAGRVYFYFARFYELTGRFAEARP